ncbi:MAG: prolyl oligopeptidase family serine peptidase [Acidobacteriota bacterium]
MKPKSLDGSLSCVRCSSLHSALACLVLATAFGAVPGAAAESAREALERADALAKAWRDGVRGERLEHWWIAPTEIIFRRWSGPSRPAHLHFDIESGATTSAVDLAVARRVLGLSEADELRVEGFAPADDGWFVRINGSTFIVDRRTRRLSPTSASFDLPWKIPKSGGTGSRNAGGSVTLEFVNELEEAVEVFWLDWAGDEHDYGVVEAGQRRRQGTGVGHLWSVRRGGHELGRFRAESGRWTIVIDAETEAAPIAVDLDEAPTDGPRGATSPDGALRAFVRHDDLWVRDLSSGKERCLDDRGTPGEPFIERFHWSPDGRTLAALREVPAEERIVRFIESSPEGAVQPRVHSLDYNKPGDRIAKPSVTLIDVPSDRRVDVPSQLFSNPWSLTRFHWTRDSAELRFLYDERGHQRRRVLGVSRTGEVRVILEEIAGTFIDYSQKTFLQWFPDDSAFLWMTERSGWNHIERVDAGSGVRTRVTSGDWLVRSVGDVDFDRGLVEFTAMGVYPEQDPYHVHYGRIGLDGDDLRWLTQGDGTHDLYPSPDGRFWVDTYSRVDLPPVHELHRADDAGLVAELARADVSALRAGGWSPPERFSAPGRDGVTPIWGLLVRPTSFDRTKRYPVVELIYAGPHGHHVPKQFSVWLGARAVAELGFVVAQIDGMGTNWRAKSFHDVSWQNLGDAGFPDRIAWWRAAAAVNPELDLERVGIYGGSAGGQNAMRALIAHSDFYDVAVADCGNHDNRMDKIWWNEAWMGWPIGPHYEESSNVEQAHRLEGELLLIVGELDRNVDPASTMQVVDALIRADKDFDLLVMPGVGHGAAGHPYARRRQAEFLVEHLQPDDPREAARDTP